MRAFWEYNISFKDPASVYAYHMFSTHHGIMWYIVIILILVYWCLYKLLQDFTRTPSLNYLSSFSAMCHSFTSKLSSFQIVCHVYLDNLYFINASYYFFMFDSTNALLYWYWCCVDIVDMLN